MLSKLSLIAALASAAVAAPLDERSFYCTEYVDKYVRQPTQRPHITTRTSLTVNDPGQPRHQPAPASRQPNRHLRRPEIRRLGHLGKRLPDQPPQSHNNKLTNPSPQDNANAILGLKAQSNPNTIAASLQTDELQLGSLSLVPFGSIEAAAPTKAFDLQSFYFGCVTDLHNDLIDGAEACSISVTGYYAAAPNQIVPVATFSFAPTAQPAPLNLATLPAYFTGLKNVTFGVAGAGTAIATTALVVDNLAHCNYK